MESFVPAPYMAWAKLRPKPRWDLAGSNLLHCSIDDLPGAREVVELDGPNSNGYRPLVEAIARRYGVAADRVATATGASGANFLVCAALLRPGDDVLVERPGYDPLLAAPQMLGARVVRFDRRFEDGYRLDSASVGAALTPRTRLIIVTNTHNPSGVLASPESLDEVAREAESVGAYVLVDEVYLDTASEAPIAPAAARSETFISTNSLTKSYGLSGLRCGWVIASPEVAEGVRRARDVVDAEGAFLADRLATLAFERLDDLARRARAILGPNREAVRRFLSSRRELEWIEAAGGTVVFPRLARMTDACPFVDRLLAEEHTAVVPGRFFEAPAHFRISFGGRADVVAHGLAAIACQLDRM
jgi:hypothetical protein